MSTNEFPSNCITEIPPDFAPIVAEFIGHLDHVPTESEAGRIDTNIRLLWCGAHVYWTETMIAHAASRKGANELDGLTHYIMLRNAARFTEHTS